MPRTISSSRPLIPSKARVDSISECEEYTKLLNVAWGVRVDGRRRKNEVISNPVSLSQSNIGDLNKGTYMVSHKSDGVRYLLFLFVRSTGSPAALMIDRANHMYEVDVIAPEEYFVHQTILEGELVWRRPDERAMIFAIFDAVRVKGVLLTHLPFSKRLQEVRRCVNFSCELSMLSDVDEISAKVTETDAIVLMPFDPPVLMEPKQFVSLEHASSIWKGRSEAKHHSDGLIVQNMDAPYQSGSAKHSIYKWKPDHTVDLKGGDASNLTTSDGVCAESAFRDQGWEMVVDASRIVGEQEDILEYHIDLKDAAKKIVRLFAMRMRPDKRAANSWYIVNATFHDAIHSISEDDLSNASPTLPKMVECQ